MDIPYWTNRWETGQVGWHLLKPHAALERFGEKHISPGSHVLVPLCGKSLDLLWLRDHGHVVTGVEAAEKAVSEFHRDHGLQRATEEKPWPADVMAIKFPNGFYRTRSPVPGYTVHETNHLSIWTGDFFGLSPFDLGLFDVVYDRAAIIALPQELRPKYAQKLLSFLAPRGKILLVTLAYDQSKMPGPPHSVSLNEIDAIFGDNFQREILCDQDVLEPRFVEKGLSEMRELTILLSLR